jgi:O-antigen/teichoic acid export membrane protein
MHVPIVLSAVAAGLAPTIAEQHHRGDNAAIASVFRASTRWALAICLPWSVVLLVTPESVLAVLFGSKYALGDAPWALRLVAIGQLVNAATGVPGVLLSMTGRPGQWAIATGALLVADVIANVLLVPKLGILGAALATTCATALLNAAGVVLARRVLGVWPYDGRMLLVLSSGGASCAAVLAVRALRLPPGIGLTACVVVAVMAAAMVMLAGGADEGRALWRTLRRRGAVT